MEFIAKTQTNNNETTTKQQQQLKGTRNKRNKKSVCMSVFECYCTKETATTLQKKIWNKINKIKLKNKILFFFPECFLNFDS